MGAISSAVERPDDVPDAALLNFIAEDPERARGLLRLAVRAEQLLILGGGQTPEHVDS